jgi:hypothetical protein
MLLRPVSWTRESLTCTFTMRSDEFIDESDRVDELVNEMRGVEVEAEVGVSVQGIQRALGRNQVVGDLGGVNFKPELDIDFGEDIHDRLPAAGEVGVTAVIKSCEVGGKKYRFFQTGLPVNPLTTLTPNFAAARAVFLTSSAQRWRTPSGSPSPHSRSDRTEWWRSSMGSSATHCPPGGC